MEKGKIEEIVKKMTLEEKAGLCSGMDFWHTKPVDRLGVPSVGFCDGPHGLRKQEVSGGDHLGLNDSIDAVCFPAACATACTFDREVLENMGVTLGKECQAQDVSVLLGPAVNIKRSPLCGRNFEYMSEDPYLAGELAAAYIKGVQSQKVGTSIKHFAANNQEHERMTGSSEMDERTLREIYLPAFETAVKESSPWTVMCSYNRLNGTYASENKKLLTDILRTEWGFEGFVMSDWGAVSDRVKGLAAGMDLEMPSSNGINDKEIVKAVKEGDIEEAVLDQTVLRILTIVYEFAENRKEESFDREKDHMEAVKIAEKCIVLLKNEGVLPLAKGQEDIVFIGGFAEKPRYQGGGSSHINSHSVPSFLEAAETYATVKYASGFSSEADEADEVKMQEAVDAAEGAGTVVVFAGLPDSFESEGYDRSHMRLPDCQNRLIERLCTRNKRVIVVLQNGSPVELPWADKVQGIVEAYLGGEGIAQAVVNILFGEANPCGKLAETFPYKLADNPSHLSFPGTGQKAQYKEGIFVGYRYYDKKEMPVRFPFGFGKSYTNFAYDNLRVSADEIKDTDTLTVTVDITNTGDREGKEIVQLYVKDLTKAAVRPEKELKGFETVMLKPGETKTVKMELGKRAFAWYHEEMKDWYAATGDYLIAAGRSSRDIELEHRIHLTAAQEPKLSVDKDTMIGTLLNHPLTAEYTKEQILPLCGQFTPEEGSEDKMVEAMLNYLPLRSVRSFHNITNEKINEMVEQLNALL